MSEHSLISEPNIKAHANMPDGALVGIDYSAKTTIEPSDSNKLFVAINQRNGYDEYSCKRQIFAGDYVNLLMLSNYIGKELDVTKENITGDYSEISVGDTLTFDETSMCFKKGTPLGKISFQVMKKVSGLINYLTVLVLKNESSSYDSAKITLIRLDSAFKGTSDIQEFDTLTDTATALKADTANNYKIVIGEDVDISIVNTIPASMFSNCTNLKYIVLSENVKLINSTAFYGSGLISIEIPNGVTRINDNAFSACEDLESATILGGSTSLGNGVFYNCTSLKEVSLPEGLTAITQDMFHNCTSLSEIELPSTITAINQYAFQYTALKNVVIPDSTQAILAYAFCNCDSLETVEIGTGLKTIADYAFYYCDNLTSVTILSEIVQTWNAYSFRNCAKLTTFAIPLSVQSIPDHVFTDVPLVSLTIPSSVVNIGSTGLSEIGLTLTQLTINKAENSISGSPWGAGNATVTWTG